MTCQTCLTPNFQDDKYCRECGTRFPPPLAVPTEADGEEPQVITLLEQAAAALESGDTEAALVSVQGALAVQPHSAAAHSALAVVYERQGKIEAAVAQLRQALALQPDRPADERKLEELLSRTGKHRAWSGSAVPRLAWVTAGATFFVVMGGGLLVRAMQTKPPATTASAVQASAGNLATSTVLPAVPANPAPLPAASRPMPSVPIPPVPNRPGSPVLVPTPLAPPRASMPRQPFSPPVERVGLPPVVNRGAPTNGLPAAAIGEVVPLPPSAASGAAHSPESPLQPPAGSGVVGAVTPAPAPPSAVPPPAPVAPARVEPLETETGFIRIEVGGRPAVTSGGPAPGVNPAPAPAPNPGAATGGNPGVAPRGAGIGLQFGGGAGSGSGLDNARAAQRNGLSALRLGRFPEARQALSQALRLYEAAAQQGGAGQDEARRGAETCRRALEALR